MTLMMMMTMMTTIAMMMMVIMMIMMMMMIEVHIWAKRACFNDTGLCGLPGCYAL